MYKLLLCWRYLLTRYLALACIVSVMLGVGTLIVVNSIMSGFSSKLRDRLHGLLSDVLVESMTYDGFPDPQKKMEMIRRSAVGDKIEAMTPTMEVFAMLQFDYRGETIVRPVRLIGIDPKTRAEVGGFAEHLFLDEKTRAPATFALSAEARQRNVMTTAPMMVPPELLEAQKPQPGQPPPPDPPPSREKKPEGIILGWALAHVRLPGSAPADIKEFTLLEPGDNVKITTVSGAKLAPVYDRFAVCSYFKSEMSEYDSNYVFVSLEYLQHLRAMDNRVTSLQMKLKDYPNHDEMQEFKKTLTGMFPEGVYKVESWEDKQGSLLGAIAVERNLLNILLFMIVGVAGFGILAIFSMIVIEKTRDIGILKALGASNGGVMKIFLGYGLLLGLVGSFLGTIIGLSITFNINNIERWLGQVLHTDIFPRDIYYFAEIPTNVQWQSVVLIVLGALAVSVLSSVLPGLRAALLHPVRALRYE